MWHVRLLAETGGRLIKSPHFSGLSTNTNVTFYCNCSNVSFTISTPQSAPSESSYRPQGAVPSTLKTTNLNPLLRPINSLMNKNIYQQTLWLQIIYTKKILH